MPGVRRLGLEAEDRAADLLLRQGMTLVARRVKTRSGEIDLVALDGEVLVIVEVRQRSGNWNLPETSLDQTKQRRLVRAAEEYASTLGRSDLSIRYDFVAVDPGDIRHLRDFFRPEPDW
ncbi:MAG: hypothetical protein HONBIEJF_01744 [Fimbriimonadaceae bacterium]|nr:hypothetical protein [Fimbriimonadaceae bacterium]